ncbi:signal peptidase II [Ruicaihuangia caeni]|uniref:signal peptidase II n=1 Tax=Ruicaihuangia caeni TaxID=3042517 RepID=UPI003390647A
MAEAPEPGAVAPATRLSVRSLVLIVAVAIVAYALDQGSKLFVTSSLPLGEAVPVLGQVLEFRYVKNPGAAFSLGVGYTWIFSIAAAGVVVFVLLFARKIRSARWALLFGMLLGGTLGNLTDRLFREPSFGQGHVIDFIQVWGFPAIFNVADIFIVSSMVLFVLLTLLGVSLDGRRHASEAVAGSPTGSREPEPPSGAEDR